MRRRLAVTVVATAAFAAVGLAGTPAEAAAPKRPDKITSVWAHAGPGAGQVTISWKTGGRNTTSFGIETGLTAFSKQTSSPLPWTGRHSKWFKVAGNKRSVTLSASQVASAGAAPKTGNHLFFRVTARNVNKSGQVNARENGKLRAVAPKAVSPKAGGKAVRVGTYNILSAKASQGRSWKTRAPEVASTIASHHPDVVALQELSPGRADGKSGGTTKSVPRQTESLEAALKKKGASRYQLTRTQSYVHPDSKHGTQGARILYNTKVVSLVTKCPEMTKTRHYNTSCSFNLPYGAGEGKGDQRSAAYAEFKYKSNGKKFLFVSVHLDPRQSSNTTTLKKYNAVRSNQMKAVVAKVAKVRNNDEPVIIAGDFNSWQNNKGGDAPHEYLASRGYYDTAAAKTKVNQQYNTFNGLAKTMVGGAQGYGNRLDTIMVKGTSGSNRYENIMSRADSTRSSDHNMVITDFRLWN